MVGRVKRSGESVGAPVAIPNCIQNPPVDPRCSHLYSLPIYLHSTLFLMYPYLTLISLW